MAKTIHTMYFAIKLVAPCVGNKSMQPCSVPGVSPTKHCTDSVIQSIGTANYLVIGGKQPANFPGIAGHFTACVLDFSDAEDAACKTVAEAERLVSKKYKAWLADAYDWYVMPANIESSSAVPAAKKAKAK